MEEEMNRELSIRQSSDGNISPTPPIKEEPIELVELTQAPLVACMQMNVAVIAVKKEPSVIPEGPNDIGCGISDDLSAIIS